MIVNAPHFKTRWKMLMETRTKKSGLYLPPTESNANMDLKESALQRFEEMDKDSPIMQQLRALLAQGRRLEAVKALRDHDHSLSTAQAFEFAELYTRTLLDTRRLRSYPMPQAKSKESEIRF